MKKTPPSIKKSPKESPVRVRKYSTDEMNRLILAILDGTDDTEEDLSRRMGKNKGYIAQTRSRNSVTERLMYALQEELNKKTAGSNADLTVSEISFLRASVTYILQELALLKAKAQNRPVHSILDESEQGIQIVLRNILKS